MTKYATIKVKVLKKKIHPQVLIIKAIIIFDWPTLNQREEHRQKTHTETSQVV